jgi:hypothetical protein
MLSDNNPLYQLYPFNGLIDRQNEFHSLQPAIALLSDKLSKNDNNRMKSIYFRVLCTFKQDRIFKI